MSITETLHKTTHIFGIWRLGANRQVKSPRAVSKEETFVSFSLSNAKRLPMKAFVQATLVSLNLREGNIF